MIDDLTREPSQIVGAILGALSTTGIAKGINHAKGDNGASVK